MRIALLVMVAACGEHGESPIDAPIDAPPVVPDAPANPGFVLPTSPLRANTEQSPDNWVDVGPADVSCLGTASTDATTTVDVALTTIVRDFQSDNVVPNAIVSVFPGEMLSARFPGSPFTANGSGSVTVDIPSGTTRFGFDITSADVLRTVELRAIAAPGQATQTFPPLRPLSKSTAATLPALVGVSRTPGTGLVLGVLRDCQDREVSNFVATVSTTAGVIAQLPGAETFYFSSSVGLPVRHTTQATASEDGQFMVIEVVPIANAFVQVWGFRDDAELAANQLTLIAELAVPVIADTVIGGGLAPLRQ